MNVLNYVIQSPFFFFSITKETILKGCEGVFLYEPLLESKKKGEVEKESNMRYFNFNLRMILLYQIILFICDMEEHLHYLKDGAIPITSKGTQGCGSACCFLLLLVDINKP